MKRNVKRIALISALAALSTHAIVVNGANDVNTSNAPDSAAAAITPKSFGSNTSDQVFTPITPCRVVDTRNVGGPIGPFTARNFFFFTSQSSTNWFALQGGVFGAAGSVCPGTVITDHLPTAAVATITVTGQGGSGNLIVWQGNNPVASASTLSYPATGDASTLATIPAGGRSGAGPGGSVEDFGVFVNAFTATNVVVDIVGYYSTPGATPLDCVNTATNDVVVGPGQFSATAANFCPATYSQIGVNCLASAFSNIQLIGYGADNVGAFNAAGDCQGINNSGGNVTLHMSLRCCRVPGH